MRHEPLVRLPDKVCFTLAEGGQLLFAVDVAVQLTAEASREGRLARRMQRLITARLWPDLGRLLDDIDPPGGVA